jgi:hypothetical protein
MPWSKLAVLHQRGHCHTRYPMPFPSNAPSCSTSSSSLPGSSSVGGEKPGQGQKCSILNRTAGYQFDVPLSAFDIGLKTLFVFRRRPHHARAMWVRRLITSGIMGVACAIGLCNCGSSSVGQASPQASASASSSPSATAAVPADWKSSADSRYGYVFRYPETWTEVNQGTTPPGFHFIASRPTLTNLGELRSTDWWLVMSAYAPDPVNQCGQPVNPLETSPLVLDGKPATRFVRQGTQNDAGAWVIDARAVWSSRCYAIQLNAGSGQGKDEVLVTFDQIAAGFRYGS